MKKSSFSRSAFFNPRVLIGFVLCSVGVLLTFAALSKSADQTPVAMATTQTPGTWTATGSMSVARQCCFTATLLTNGKVLVAGGSGTGTSAELYDSTTGTWTPTGSMRASRAGHTATLLPDGKVLVAGGQDIIVNSSAELYDPDTGLWTLTGSMNVPRSFHMGTLITGGPLSGMVIIAAGSSEGGGGSNNLVSAELYDPSTALWAYTGSMTVERYFELNSPTVLPDGSVLIMGGTDCCPYYTLNEAELYDSISQTWTPTTSKTTPAKARSVLLPGGKVLVAGGSKGTQGTDKNVAAAELFDPTTGTWTATARMSTGRNLHTLTLLSSGQALVAGGASGGAGVCNDLTSAELYDSSVGTWSVTGDMTVARFNQTATLLPNGQVLVAGGQDCEGNVRSSAELYTPPSGGSTCLPPPPGLVSWWSGDRTADDVQGTNNGALLNGASFRPGKVGPGFAFDGVNDWVRIPNSPSLSQTRITLDAWVYVTGKQGTHRHIISKDNVFREREYSLAVFDTDVFACFVGLPSGIALLIGTTSVQLDTWYHVAMTHDGAKLRLYVNGVLDGILDAVGDVVRTSNPVGIGGNAVADVFFPGIIDEAQIFSRALTDAEILAIYQAGADGQCKPEIFVSSITPSYSVVHSQFLVSTSVAIQDTNGIGPAGATVNVKTLLPNGTELGFSAVTDESGTASISFHTGDTGLYKFKVRNVSLSGRIYDASLNIETQDTLVIP